MSRIHLVLGLAFLSLTQACVSGPCRNTLCSDIPSDNVFHLTSFCDKEIACGKWSGNCYEYYAADAQRFGCGSTLKCCRSGKCINLKVIDEGPNCWIDDNGHKQVIDASFSTCKYFTGHPDCGWEDKIAVTCTKIAKSANLLESGADAELPSAAEVPLGPCEEDLEKAISNNMPHCHGKFLPLGYEFMQ